MNEQILETRLAVLKMLLSRPEHGEKAKNIAKKAIEIADAIINYQEGSELDKALKIAQ